MHKINHTQAYIFSGAHMQINTTENGLSDSK